MQRVRPRQPIRTDRVRLARLPLAAAICLAVAPSVFAQDNSQGQSQSQSQGQTPPAPPATPSKPKTLGTVSVIARFSPILTFKA